MCLKALLAPSQGAQHLPGCISEQLVCMQPLSLPTHCFSLPWRCRLYSSKTLKHILELWSQDIRRDNIHMPKCEQHWKSQPQKCGNTHMSVWVKVFHVSKWESYPVTLEPSQGSFPRRGGWWQHFLPRLHLQLFLRLAGLTSRNHQK